MKFHSTNIEGCFEIEPRLLKDDRGSFFRVFCEDEFEHISKQIHFTQINHSINVKKGTFRGMHYQSPPYAEDKLIRCISGKVIDFFLDLRKDSPTFMQYGSVELSAENKRMIFLCKGIAHGFYTLEDCTELIYHHTEKYTPSADSGIRYNDPRVNIKLPGPIELISDKDLNYPLIKNDFKGISL